jgi:hypothetical protein
LQAEPGAPHSILFKRARSYRPELARIAYPTTPGRMVRRVPGAISMRFNTP